MSEEKELDAEIRYEEGETIGGITEDGEIYFPCLGCGEVFSSYDPLETFCSDECEEEFHKEMQEILNEMEEEEND